MTLRLFLRSTQRARLPVALVRQANVAGAWWTGTQYSARSIALKQPSIPVQESIPGLARYYSSAQAMPNITDLQEKPLHDKILIANRGEIACRVIKTAKELGVKTVAVYSEADRDAIHVRMADEAFCLGPASSSESYLRQDRILWAAKASGARAIHPGYGFLSENATFAEKCASEGIVFIGPPPSAITSMGSKSESKDIMIAAGVPVVPGYHGSDQSLERLMEEADRISYPVLIKAIKGGGGKGMRVVQSAAEFEEMLGSARREAINSFGDDQVLVEKYLVKPRHVEVQVFADTLGNVVHLHERDCSVQRRHQKVFEEAPAPGLTPELRNELGGKAVAAARAVGYVGAGTVEFIFDDLTGEFFFMEMNTRLQVEHPVTEMITGTDLVHWQLRVAAGNALPMEQADIPMRGHAIEARIYAENPKKNFVPDTGKLLRLRPPHTHITPTRSVRVDTGVEEGGEVSVHYDPMIAKLIVHGPDRPEALRMMDKALGDYQVAGLSTNIEFLRNIVTHPDFLAGEVETGFIPKHSKELFPPEESKDFPVKTVGKAMLSLLLQQEQGYVGASPPQEDPYSPFSSVKSWRLGHPSSRTLTCLWEGMKAHVTLTRLDRPDSFYDLSVEVEGNPDMNCTYSRIFARLEKGPDAQGLTRIEMEGSEAEGMGVRSNVTLSVVRSGEEVDVFEHDTLQHTTLTLPIPPHLLVGGGGDGGAGGAGNVLSPMPCKLTQVLVKAGQKVSAGDALVVVEAMKMEHVVKAPKDGVVERVVYEEIGCLIPEKKVLVTFHSSEEVVKEDA